jgi:pyroglutamyl-peptidase
MTTILVTGFGPFPGAPFNPTGPLVEGLARLRRPALADVTIVPYVFETSYAAVDRELPRLLTRHKPDALLMFGLAPRANTLCIETRARNAVALLSDVSGKTLLRNSIVRGGPPALTIPAQARRLFATVRTTRIPVLLSRDAGRYLCNYLCWRASEAAARKELRLAAFVHVPPIARTVRRPDKRKALTLDNLSSAASQLLLAVAAAARR